MNNISTATAAPISTHRKRLGDEAFIAALDFAEFRNAPTIARMMLAAGTPASLPTITKRMIEYVAHTNAVEASGKAWRLVAANDDETPPPPPVLKNIQSSRKARRASFPAKMLVAPANDNATPLSVGLHQMCGLELMRSLPDNSVPLVLCDLPYGTTSNNFDPKINVEEWFAEMRRIVTPRGAIIAFCIQPFTTDLMNAGRDIFKTEITWEKATATGYPQSHRRMMKAHETILVFSKGTVVSRGNQQMTYNPQGAEAYVSPNRKRADSEYIGKPFTSVLPEGAPVDRLRNCPRDVVFYPKDPNVTHPFAKPLALLEMLIRTYSNEGNVVLDPTMGSGSTGVACIAAGRLFIGAENGYKKNGDCIFAIAKKRIAEASMAS